MMNRRSFLASSVSAAGAALAQSVSAADNRRKLAVMTVFENGGVIQDREDYLNIAKHVLGQLTNLRKNRDTRNAEISIIVTANPTQVTWSGTPEELLEQAAEVVKLTEVRDTCSDLILALEQVETVVDVTFPDELHLYLVGPAIHAGFPCDGAEGSIRLPQPVPPGLKLGELAKRASVLKMINVHPDQDEVYTAYFRDNGILDRARSGEMVFDLLDPGRTRSKLKNLIWSAS